MQPERVARGHIGEGDRHQHDQTQGHGQARDPTADRRLAVDRSHQPPRGEGTKDTGGQTDRGASQREILAPDTEAGPEPQFAELHQVRLGQITSSPLPTPCTKRARKSAEVHEFTVTTCGASTAAASSCSKAMVSAPIPIQPERITREMAATSSSPKLGRPKGRYDLRSFTFWWWGRHPAQAGEL